jgi:hypothetical protein
MSTVLLNERTRMLKTWNRRGGAKRKQSNFVSRLLRWADFRQLAMPLHGEDVACFLVDLLEDGVPPDEIRRAAAAITGEYERQGCFLDGRPIRTALRLIAEQTAPGRVIH